MVCADLILQGHIAYPSEQGLHYDVVVDLGGKLLRIQVKTTRTHKAVPQRKNYTPSYLFNARRCGKGGRQSYSNSDCDIIAFVVLDKKLIGYVPIEHVGQTMHFRSKDFDYRGNKSGIYIEDYTFHSIIGD